MILEAADREAVLAILKARVPAGVRVDVFGSRAHGRNLKPFSDLDLCLTTDGLLDPELLIGLAVAFRDSNLPIKVDLIDWHAVTAEFRAAIAADLEPVWPVPATACGR